MYHRSVLAVSASLPAEGMQFVKRRNGGNRHAAAGTKDEPMNEITTYQIRRGKLTGAVTIKVACPRCDEPLTVSEDEIGKPDQCPSCNTPFQLSTARLKAFHEVERKSTEKVGRDRTKAAEAATLKEFQKTKERENKKSEYVAPKVPPKAATKVRLAESSKVVLVMANALLSLSLLAFALGCIGVLREFGTTYAWWPLYVLLSGLGASVWFGLVRCMCLAMLLLSEKED
ncbi:MAG: hypothetical protein ABGZ35_25630 [Planctomycetaceae bacterium]